MRDLAPQISPLRRVLESISDVLGVLADIGGTYGLIVVVVGFAVWQARRHRWLDRLVHRWNGRARDDQRLRTAWEAGVFELAGFGGEEAPVPYSISLTGMPALRPMDPADAPDLRWLADQRLRAAARAHKPKDNKPHGLAADGDFKQPNVSIVRFVQTDYATVLAAWDLGYRPPVLSGNAIAFCPTTREVLIQVRSPTAKTYPNCLHVLGGNYEPALPHRDNDDLSLQRASLREVWEESQLLRADGGASVVLVSQETRTGFVRFTYAGLSIPSTELGQLAGGREGPVVWASFKALQEYATTGLFEQKPLKMVPSGALDLLLWLRMGAPDERRQTPASNEALATYHVLKRLLPGRLARNPWTGE